MKIARKAAESLLDGLGFHTVKNWPAERVQEKLNKLPDMLDGTEEIKDDASKKLLAKIKTAGEAKEKIVLEVEDEDADETPAPKSKTKSAKEEAAEVEAEDDETPAPKKKAAAVAEDDEDVAPAPKKKAKLAPVDASEHEEEPDTKPTKKVVVTQLTKTGKPAKAGKSQAGVINAQLVVGKTAGKPFAKILAGAQKQFPEMGGARLRTHLYAQVKKGLVKQDAEGGYYLVK